MDPKVKAFLDRSATHNSIRDLVGAPAGSKSSRSEPEEACGASLPGDDVSDQGLDNKYLHLASTRPLQVKKLIESGQLSPEDAEEARQALGIYSALDGQSVWGQRR